MEVLVSVDGKVLKPGEAVVSVFDRGFLFGDGVYEAGRSYDRCFLYLEEHFRRLRASAEKLQISIPWSDGELQKTLFDVANAFGKSNVHFRLIVTRGTVDHIGLDVLDHLKPTLVCFVQDLPGNLLDLRKNGMRLMTSKIIRNSARAQDPNIKTSNYLNSLLALQDVRARGGSDGVMCDSDGNVTEGTTFSLFGVTEGDVLLTASLDVGILDSITRRHVLSIARHSLTVREGRVSLNEFQNCREIFVASSVREIIPVVEWDAKKYHVTGKVTQMLQDKLKEEIAAYVRSGIKF